MADMKLFYASATALACSLSALASTGIVFSGTVDNTSLLYLDYLIDLTVADVVEAGNKQIVLYGRSSIDGTNFSNADTLNHQAMTVIGYLPLNGTGPWQSRAFGVAQAFGGIIPPKFQVVIYNDAGVALATLGNSMNIRGVYATSA